jgi:hypothetical protein
MPSITIPLSDEQMMLLRRQADQSGLSPEELLRLRVKQMLDRPQDEFDHAASYVLLKNAKLYRRLA